ncbi:MAG: hypothetical protein AB7P22_14885, partial [Vicinamibacterales bacterium]
MNSDVIQGVYDIGAAQPESQPNPVETDTIDAASVHPKVGSISVLPWEVIDTFSGALTLTFNDVVLPGDAGLDLHVTRSYSSKDGRWRFGIGPDAIFDDPNDLRHPIVMDVGGGQQPMFLTGSPGVYLTTDLWRYTVTATDRVLETPQGLVYRYAQADATGNVRYLTSITDAFGNVVTLTYLSHSLQGMILERITSAGRQVTFSYYDNGRPFRVTVHSV